MNSRAGRQEWWLGFFFAHFIGVMAERILVGALETAFSDDLQFLIAGALIRAAATIGILAVQYRVSVRRAHDLDIRLITLWPYVALYSLTSAWAFFRPLMGFGIPGFWVPVFLMVGWLVFQLGIRPGNRSSNQWGPPPKPENIILPKSDNYRPPRP